MEVHGTGVGAGIGPGVGPGGSELRLEKGGGGKLTDTWQGEMILMRSITRKQVHAHAPRTRTPRRTRYLAIPKSAAVTETPSSQRWFIYKNRLGLKYF